VRISRHRSAILAILSLPVSALFVGGVSQAQILPTHESAAVSGHKWCDPLKVFLPKPGFKPLLASGAQLRANGFPSRPSAADPTALADWERAVAHAKHFSAPHPVCGTVRHTTSYNGIWAAHIVPKSDYSNSDFVQTESQWTQPSVPANSSYTNYQDAPDASFWNGIGISDLIQAGCDSITLKSATYKCWTEDYPEGTIWEGPAPAPGDLMFSEVSYLGGDETYYYLENEYTGNAESFTNASPDVGSNAANFVNERLSGLYLPNYDTVYMSDNTFWQANNTEHTLTTTNNVEVMTSNCKSSGTVLASVGSVSSGAFFFNWNASSPYKNGC
jgi:hypothetical protein